MTIQESDRGGVQVISRAAAILRCLEDEPSGLSLGAIAKRSGLPRSTVQRLVDALAHEDLLEVHGRGGVCLGPALMRLASHSHVDITQKARPYLEELSRVTGETAVLVGASGTELMILQTIVSPHALRVAPVAGNFLSIYATSGGKILLSNMHDQAIRELLGPELKQFTPKTPTLPQLLKQLEQIRKGGFAYDFDEHTMGVGAIAVGIQTPQGRYAIDVVGPVWRMEEGEEAIKSALLKCQEDLINGLRSID
ncbi:IclR family transcriptional regulator [Pseudomonas sp. FW215-R2]|uniref:IclR family transcriptional regulator n=1 Tax=unclassified Pseudomonas TaxID=196821 RepID=UPI000C88651B|nr:MULTISPECIES: IclR family transcriptional regulator [unclassified Pseudomonas]PMX03087.1 IclR family transcriptional regulator [Pseudomonas sp. FW215-R2]PMX11948.1 IclR family transcriptional regulator [Pseudomonas sp. FW215-L1]PMX25618.1 IclR family transcriptional regulator [Pseudomonas sp. FW215-E1]PNA32620.1 IclR family transcriptional regulator [Pseudomonas sp. FW215-R4]